ncbi:MAG: hypothetical protein GY847_40125 [Proteobacteria bacterium]|nr:hypothetical protein [Pseudomonadota bacterium]
MFERWPWAKALFVAVVIASYPLGADDLKYISNEELSQEIESRKTDITRTRSRLKFLLQDEIRGHQELIDAKSDAARVEKLVVARAKLFYRLFRNGASVRYLLGSTSATQLLKRISLLRRLLREGFECQRKADLKLSKAESRLVEIRQEKLQATNILSMLNESIDQLQAEKSQRVSKSKFAVN